MASRCSHGMIERACTVRSCDHYDGGRARTRPKAVKEFLKCTSEACRKTCRRSDMTIIGDLPYCKECAFCAAECSRLRRKGSIYCQACFDEIAKPKQCKTCEEILTCEGVQDHHARNHAKRDRCGPCGRRFATRQWGYARKASVSA